MSDWPLAIAKQIIQNAGADPSASRGTVISPGGAANTKGSWVELIASTDKLSTSMLIYIGWWGGGNGDYLIDIAIGGAGSEQPIAQNLLFSVVVDRIFTYFIPVTIPEGSRISARMQSSNASTTSVRVMAQVMAASEFLESSGMGRVETLGANTADSGGVSVDPGTTANTKGAWVEIGTFTQPIRALTLAFGGQANTTRSNCTWLLDIGIGAGGSEVVKIPDIALLSTAPVDHVSPCTLFLPINLPAVRLSARSQCSITTATNRLFDVIAYGTQ